MRRATVLSLALMMMASTAASARIVVWTGEIQWVENGSVVKRSPAVVTTKKRGTDYTCTAADGKKLELETKECMRRGSHILCSRKTSVSKTRGWSGVVCWGDVYLKKP